MTPVRRAALALASLLLLVVALDSAAWFWVTQRMLAMLPEWQAARAAEGVVVGFASPVAAGWPFAAEIDLPAARVATDGGLLAWQAERVGLRLSPFHPTILAVTVRGAQSLQAGGLPPITIAAHSLEATVPLDHSGGVVIDGLSVTATSGSAALAIGLLAVRLDAAGLALAASRLVVSGVDLPFGGAIDRVAAHLHLSTAIPPFREPARAAAAWVSAGGRLVVDDASVRWGAMDAEGHGELGLDPALQPVATGTVRMAGYGEAIEALVRAGTITRTGARVAGTVLALLATPGQGGAAVVEVPLTLRGGQVAMGAIPLARLPALTWP